MDRGRGCGRKWGAGAGTGCRGRQLSRALAGTRSSAPQPRLGALTRPCRCSRRPAAPPPPPGPSSPRRPASSPEGGVGRRPPAAATASGSAPRACPLLAPAALGAARRGTRAPRLAWMLVMCGCSASRATACISTASRSVGPRRARPGRRRGARGGGRAGAAWAGAAWVGNLGGLPAREAAAGGARGLTLQVDGCLHVHKGQGHKFCRGAQGYGSGARYAGTSARTAPVPITICTTHARTHAQTHLPAHTPHTPVMEAGRAAALCAASARSAARCLAQSAGVSTWPNMMVEVVGRPAAHAAHARGRGRGVCAHRQPPRRRRAR